MTPAEGAAEQYLAPLNFTYDPSLTPRVYSVTPTSGPAGGGTRMTLTGAFPAPPPGGVTVWLGAGAAAAPCGNVTLVNASQIECVTGDAGWPRPSAAVARVRVVYDGWGEALHEPAANGSTEVSFNWFELWSSPATWRGRDPPAASNHVTIPAGRRVVLDVSTPVLGSLVLEGALEFDGSAAGELNLQAHSILIDGGSLTAGSADAAHAGTAVITLHGRRDSSELPLFGTKVIAVRDGTLFLRGRPKTPAWAHLNATAFEGAAEIVVEGAVNWEVGKAR
ncbi:hypothetical protein MNEG_0043 [Monoraphidium neglectum]|uniref:G8 domain-containing protein n=1 Tax=Monoraphidium neglectum TaxID=145388 RepID=A0A0D2NV31_9CHLO|nr:hypothetical protein MNEG_0043 [Monoraphidium neglectum]KIZ07926.1 hypothetical protein MNEG_0043 [Monoraphidium neglectum]|eukprot:XP_013906945.1 hypothetical protein MNEG_0043 [Monoraphidium neglectum]